MGNQHSHSQTFKFEISNFSQSNTAIIQSDVFSIRSCKWYVALFPKGNGNDTHLSVYLHVADPHTLPQNWSRFVKFSFVIVDQNNIPRSQRLTYYNIYKEKEPNWGYPKAWPLTDLQTKFLVNDKLTIQVYVKVKSAIGGLDPVLLLKKIPEKTVNVNGFNVLSSREKSAKLILETYPGTVLYIQPQDPQVRNAYMNVLVRIYEKLYNSPLKKLTEAELKDVSKSLVDLTQVGFKLEWFREKLENVSAERKRLSGYEAQAEELGKQLKNLELMMCNLKDEIKLKAQS